MVSGGARVRSGPIPDPLSTRSEHRKYRLSALPNGGYHGRVPAFPLAEWKCYKLVNGKKRVDSAASKAWRNRETEIWESLWVTPQACAWSLPQYSFLLFDIAMYCRQFVLCESSDASASDRGLLPRYADRIGLSAAGMAALGWKVMADEVGARRNGVASEVEEVSERPQRRLRG
jgi:hypothetical protein